MTIKTILFFRLKMLMVLSLLYLSGCQTLNQQHASTEKVAHAEMAIHRAQESDAEKLAPSEFYSATENFKKAKHALQNKAYYQATQLAEKALVEAQLAEAKAELEMAHQAVNKLRQEVKILTIQ